MYIYICIHKVHTISFQTFFVRAFKIVVDFENSVYHWYTTFEMNDQFL